MITEYRFLLSNNYDKIVSFWMMTSGKGDIPHDHASYFADNSPDISSKKFLKIDKQLSFEFLEQWTIFELGKRILIMPIHLKFKGALSVIKGFLALNLLR